jgi:hypothetical protein
MVICSTGPSGIHKLIPGYRSMHHRLTRIVSYSTISCCSATTETNRRRLSTGNIQSPAVPRLNYGPSDPLCVDADLWHWRRSSGWTIAHSFDRQCGDESTPTACFKTCFESASPERWVVPRPASRAGWMHSKVATGGHSTLPL